MFVAVGRIDVPLTTEDIPAVPETAIGVMVYTLFYKKPEYPHSLKSFLLPIF